jgi:Tfp pilus assembly protein PilF/TolB-like protein
VLGQTISHYRVLEKIGAGGMGVVYRAHDERLDRDVALKFLPPHSFADPAARKNFRQEALTLSKLNHPNVAFVFDFDTQGDTDFIVTEYVPGITLDAKLAGSALPEAEILRLGVQLASGLEAAHRQGIVHRDLKPGNLRLTPEGRLKILDFGLARLLPRASEIGATETLSKSIEVSGTLPYMAPEQLRGESTDLRSDIWSAGAVLYEMATGKRPFPEPQPALLISAILNNNPQRPRETNRKISSGMETIILKSLEKDATRRCQSAGELRLDLERLEAGIAPVIRSSPKAVRRFWLVAIVVLILAGVIGGVLWRRETVAVAAKPRRTVAVLGFKNLNGQPSDAWISTALSEMLTTELGANGKLRTISGENVARMKADLSLPESESLTGETLRKVDSMVGTDLVVLGSYLKIGDQIRVDFRVQNTSTGEVVASAPEQGTEAQFFDLVKRSGEALRQYCGAGELTAEQRAATDAAEPASTEAVRLYAEGVKKLRDFDFLAARDLLQQATAADPKNSLSHSALAAAWSQLGYDEKAKAEAKKAYETSTNLPPKDKLSIEAGYREQNHEWATAIDLYRSLWTFFPDDVDYGLHVANAQIAAGKGQEAFVTLQTLRKLPARLSGHPRIEMAEAAAADSVSDYKREQAATVRAIEKARAEGARLLEAQAVLQQCWALRNMGDLAGAKAAGDRARNVLAATGDLRAEARSLTCVGNVLADQGDLTAARKMHEDALALVQKTGSQKDIAGALINIGNILASQQNLDESTAHYKQALAVSLEINDKPATLVVRNNIGANLMVECDFTQARSVLQEALQTAREIGDEQGIVDAMTNLGAIFLNQGDFTNTAKTLAEAIDKARKLDLKSSIASNLISLGDMQLAQDNLVAAEKSYQEAMAIRTTGGQRGDVAAVQLSIANLKLETNLPQEADNLARQASAEFHGEKVGDQEAMAYIVLTQALLVEKKLEEAKASLQQAREIAPRDKTIVLSLDTAGARLATATGTPSDALRQLKSVIARAQSMSVPNYEYQARLAVAEAQNASGAPARAIETLRQVQKDAAQAGYKLIARNAAEAQRKIQKAA